jgi:tetratricopeptide (TPR) repeat protein
VATYENLIALADIIQERYGAFDRAEPLYRRFIELDPGRYEAHYGLAASLQKQGRTREGIKVVESYIAGYGEHEKMVEALQILRNALAQEGEE